MQPGWCDGRSIVYVAKSVAPTPFASSVNVGTRLPAHATVLGRVLLEDLSLAELRELYPESQLEVFSKAPRAPSNSCSRWCSTTASAATVLQEGFFEASISTIAAPVRDRSGKVAAAMGATIPASRIDPEQLGPMVEQVRHVADELAPADYRPAAENKVVNLYRE